MEKERCDQRTIVAEVLRVIVCMVVVGGGEGDLKGKIDENTMQGETTAANTERWVIGEQF